ncbi:class I SAM-dependent methyltransferase [Porticoccus sp.]|uniref:class I SAM-dependent methyltransferase n=1 Tax=Porticoccus sp. TaxID=2024853 RepID=UPI003F69B16F
MNGSDLDANGMTAKPANSPVWLETQIIRLLQRKLGHCQGSVSLQFPSGYRHSFGQGEAAAHVRLHSMAPLVRLFFGGTNGWSDSYLNSEWDCTNLTTLIQWAIQNEPTLNSMAKAGYVNDLIYNLYHWSRRNTRRGSRRNIAAHYDLGNDFYREWLDPGMTYSAAMFDDDHQQSLQQAQTKKYQRILNLLAPRERNQVLEIGCGWGEFALQAAETANVQVHGITLSSEQQRWAEDKLADADLTDQVTISLTDYRDLKRQYDGVVSIEMFEAVGEANWDTYFKKLKGVLKPGGRAVLQIITIDEKRFEVYRKQADFIQRHIFPGGMLPSVMALKQKFSQHGFGLIEQEMFGEGYARTLELWRQRFEDRWPKISTLGFDQRFYRLWRYYLSYCEGGFKEGAINVGLFVLEHQSDR